MEDTYSKSETVLKLDKLFLEYGVAIRGSNNLLIESFELLLEILLYLCDRS